MQRVSVVGCSGAGKTTLARELAARHGLEHVELDALHHEPGWRPRPRDDLRGLVLERLAAPRWVVDGNYRSQVQDLVWPLADTVVWLDLPRFTVMRAIVLRTLRRIVRREELWNGNRERWANFFDPRPEENVILWAWTHHPLYRAQYTAAAADPEHAHLRFVRLRSREAVRRFLGGPSTARGREAPAEGDLACPSRST